MRKYIVAISLIIIFLAVLAPFASTSPDGLEKVAENLGVEEQTPFWRGLMFDYSAEAVSNPYVSTLIAGVVGTGLVLIVCLALGEVLVKKSRSAFEDRA